MRLDQRQPRLDALLAATQALWHAQPFCTPVPAWAVDLPALRAELDALSEAAVAHLNDDSAAAQALLARHLPGLAELTELSALPIRAATALNVHGPHWCRDIPGRKREQIEAFAAAAQCSGRPLIDWCGGKGHLGRLLALAWAQSVHTLEIDPVLCAEGAGLADRLRLAQDFIVGDALATDAWPRAGQHAVALHACGELHRHLLVHGAARGVGRFDVAPCCYHRGVSTAYQALSPGLQTQLTRDDTRLAVTETVTASPRLTRQRDKEMAWKLGFDAYRRAVLAVDHYQPFKPVPAAWFRQDFTAFLCLMAGRAGLPAPAGRSAGDFEGRGWQRQRQVMRYSIVRHAFRRPLEIWLALDLAGFLEAQGYVAELGVFCRRQLTPRNLLLSARLA